MPRGWREALVPTPETSFTIQAPKVLMVIYGLRRYRGPISEPVPSPTGHTWATETPGIPHLRSGMLLKVPAQQLLCPNTELARPGEGAAP